MHPPAGTLSPYFRSPPRCLSLTTPRQRRPPAHGDQVPTLHGHIAGRRFLGGQPQSHGGLDKARFHPDVQPLLPPPAAPHPSWRPGPPRRITAGPSARRGPSMPARPSPCSCSRCPAPWHPPPAAIPEQNKAGEGALRGAEPGPVTLPPPLTARPPRPVTSGPSGPAPGRPGTNPQRMQNLGVGAGAPGRTEGVPGRGSDWKEKEGACRLFSTPTLRAGDPSPRVSEFRRLTSLVSDL